MTAQAIATKEAAAPGAPTPAPEAPVKSRSRLNAFKHGLTGHQFVFSPGQAEAYAAHSSEIHKHYQAHGPIEQALVRQIADGIWRLDRASAIEHGIFSMALDALPANGDAVEAALAPAQTWLAEAKNLALLTLYVKRIENKLDANKAELSLIQANRKQEAEEAMEQAIALRRAAEIEGKPYLPEAFFTRVPAVKDSVFSADLVTREIARHKVIQAARQTISDTARQSYSRRDAA